MACARASFRAAIMVDPSSHEAWRNLALALEDADEEEGGRGSGSGGGGAADEAVRAADADERELCAHKADALEEGQGVDEESPGATGRDAGPSTRYLHFESQSPDEGPVPDCCTPGLTHLAMNFECELLNALILNRTLVLGKFCVHSKWGTAAGGRQRSGSVQWFDWGTVYDMEHIAKGLPAGVVRAEDLRLTALFGPRAGGRAVLDYTLHTPAFPRPSGALPPLAAQAAEGAGVLVR